MKASEVEETLEAAADEAEALEQQLEEQAQVLQATEQQLHTAISEIEASLAERDAAREQLAEAQVGIDVHALAQHGGM